MSRYDFLIEKLIEDGFSEEELEFLLITEDTLTDEELIEYMNFGVEYEEFIEKLNRTMNTHHSDCALC